MSRKEFVDWFIEHRCLPTQMDPDLLLWFIETQSIPISITNVLEELTLLLDCTAWDLVYDLRYEAISTLRTVGKEEIIKVLFPQGDTTQVEQWQTALTSMEIRQYIEQEWGKDKRIWSCDSLDERKNGKWGE